MMFLVFLAICLWPFRAAQARFNFAWQDLESPQKSQFYAVLRALKTKKKSASGVAGRAGSLRCGVISSLVILPPGLLFAIPKNKNNRRFWGRVLFALPSIAALQQILRGLYVFFENNSIRLYYSMAFCLL